MPTILKPIADFLVRRGTEPQVFDLSETFSGQNLSYTVTNSNGEVLSARVEAGQLILDYGDTLDYSDLQITATDALGASVTENLRVRVTGENAYTIAVLPDTQDYSYADGAPTLALMTQWLVDQKDGLGIQFVTHVGDVTAGASQQMWQNVTEALSILDGQIPYSLTAGNHDQGAGGSASDHSTTWMDYYYSPEHQAEVNDTFGGVYDMAPERAPNNYHTFTSPDGVEWLVLSLEFGPSDDVIRWAKDVIEDNLDKRVILTTHAYMNWAGRHDSTGSSLYGEGAGYDYGLGQQAEGTNDGETLYRELVKPYGNVTFTFSGHIFGDGAETLESYDDFGNPVYQMLVNYQNGVANEIQHGNGGSGAIRLVTIDPENNQAYTSTYFALTDSYLSDDRGETLDRDGLDGPYRGQEETLSLDLSAPALHAIAKAGNDLFVTTEGNGDAQVTLQGAALNPGEDAGLHYVWKDADGNVVAEGATPTLELPAGRHFLTLEVTGSTGAVSRDAVQVIVANDSTLLVDSFNDGDAQGWGRGSIAVEPVATHGSTDSFGIAGLPAASAPVTPAEPTDPTPPTVPATATEVVLVPATAADQALLLKPGFGPGLLASYSIVFDLMVPADTAGGYIGLIQSDLSNGNDADMFLRLGGDSLSVGTASTYAGAMSLDAWHRVVLTYDEQDDGSVVITKYIDGAAVGAQTVSAVDAARYALDGEKGVLLFADNDGETAPVAVSAVSVTGAVLSAAQIAEMGGTTAGGAVLPDGVEGARFRASELGFKPQEGTGSLEPRGDFALGQVTDVGLGVPLPPAPTETMAAVLVSASTGDNGLVLSPGIAGTDGHLASYSLAFDLMVPAATAAGYMSLLQSSAVSGGDADMFMKLSGAGFSLGTMSDYAGEISLDAWHRVVLTFAEDNGRLIISKYVDGVLVGAQDVAADARYALDLENGALLFGDDDGETAPVAVSAISVTGEVLTAAQVAALGGTSAGGIALPEGVAGSEIVAGANGLAVVSGPATVAASGEVTLTPTTDAALGVPLVAPATPELPETPETPETPQTGISADVTLIGALQPQQVLHVTAAQPVPAGMVATEYSLVYDILIPTGGGSWLSFLQTDVSNRSDADLFRNASNGIGISSDYEGRLTSDTWHRVAFTLAVDGDTVLISKYIDGVLVGTTTGSAERFQIDLNEGFLLFSDNDGETSDVYVKNVLFTDHVFSQDEVAALGGVSPGPILETAPSQISFQLDFSGETITDTYGNANASLQQSESQTGNFVVKGSYAERVDGVEVDEIAEGRVYEGSNTGENVLVWEGEGAREWQDYRYELTLKSTDQDTIGAVFYFQDEANTYRVTFNSAQNTRELVRVKDGVETVLASVHAGSPWARDAQLEVAVTGGEIRVFLDGQSVFGTVTDADPLSGGSVGFYSDNQHSSQFDNVYVGALGLQAHAGRDLSAVDTDGDGQVTVTLDAGQSYGDAEITGWRWLDAEGNEIATGPQAEVTLSAAGQQTVTLEITDASGRTDRDTLIVDAVGQDRVLFSDDFSDADYAGRWTIVDEGEQNGAGEDGSKGDWQVIDGRLTQTTDVDSRQLSWTSADAADDWERGWSPLGDGTHVLRKGTYALISDPAAQDWSQYQVETRVETPDNGALGLLLNYQDPDNYYKVELDAASGTSLFQLIEVKDGVEKYLIQIPARYTPGEAFDLRVTVDGATIQAFMDGNPLFSYAITGSGSDHGTVGLYSWGSQGVSFDDVTVLALDTDGPQPAPVPNTAPVAQRDTGYRVRTGESILIAAAALLLNDTDANADPLTITEVASSAGTVVLQDGQVLFTPAPDHIGRATFTYTVADGQGGSDSAEVEVIVMPEGGVFEAQPEGGVLTGDSALDTLLLGGAGADQILASGGDDLIEADAGDDVVLGGAGADSVRGGDGDDLIFGGDGGDAVTGEAGDDVLLGGRGDDVLHGGDGADTLFGGDGADVLTGGKGDDFLAGGAGADTFTFVPGGGRDVVTDFTAGEDVIDLSGFTGLHDFEALSALLEEIDGGVVLHLDDATTVQLSHVGLDALSADDFRFA